MTDTAREAPDALRLADALDGAKLIDDSLEWAKTLWDAAAELRRLHAEVALLKAEREWIPVAERLPPPHTTVLCFNRNGYQFQGRVCYGMHEPFFAYPRGDGNASNTAPLWIDVTHWMPLPAPPQEKP